MAKERGYAIQETVSAINFEYHLKVLARERDQRMKRKKKKEACTGATVQTSGDVNVKKPLNNYTTNKEECQDGTSGDNPGGEIRQQRCSELPVHLL